MDEKKCVEHILRDLRPLEGTGRFAKVIITIGSGPWYHAVCSYQIDSDDIKTLDIRSLVKLVSEKRMKALDELMVFLEKQVGKAKKVYGLEGWFLRELIMSGKAVRLDPRSVLFGEAEDPIEPGGVSVYIDCTYGFA